MDGDGRTTGVSITRTRVQASTVKIAEIIAVPVSDIITMIRASIIMDMGIRARARIIHSRRISAHPPETSQTFEQTVSSAGMRYIGKMTRGKAQADGSICDWRNWLMKPDCRKTKPRCMEASAMKAQNTNNIHKKNTNDFNATENTKRKRRRSKEEKRGQTNRGDRQDGPET